MTDKKMPAFRIIFRTRDKQKFDCATVWPGKFPDSYDISPVLEWSGGQYPKMALAEALQRVANKDGWLSLVTIGQKRDAKPQQQDFGGGDDFSDDSIPF
jgi:hypothetical protein